MCIRDSSLSFLIIPLALKSTGAIGNMGSDLLERPEDENSPEFATYLKQLMSLQVNRSKAGFSAPSSGSADAYLAKLNRIKVERMALRRAGLPEDLVDTSYKKEDYINAAQEAAEPLISNGILTGDAAIASPTRSKAGGKARPLSAEEISQAKAAEESVARALAQNKALPPDQQLKLKEPAAPVVKVNNEDLDVINDILLRAAASGNKIAANAVRDMLPSAEMPKFVTPAAKTSYSEALKEAQQSKASITPQVKQPQKIVEAIAQPVQQPKQQPKQQPQQQVKTQPSEAPKVSATQTMEYGRKLKVEELEVAAKALQLLVKHRGGGPFGIGRLAGGEVNSLEKNLRNVYAMLENDMAITKKEGKIIGEDRSKTRAEDDEALPDLKKAAAAPQPPVVVQKTAPVAKATPLPPVAVQQKPASVPVPAPAPAPAPAKTAPAPAQLLAPVQSNSEVTQVPISAGLESFLQSPQYLSIQELSGLRDGLIQCLSMIQMEISKRPLDAPTNVPAVPLIPQPVDNMKVLERVMQTNQKFSSDEIDKDVKIALGLLLKHRGGPGFGHGRLEGRELSLLEDKLRKAADVMLEEAV